MNKNAIIILLIVAGFLGMAATSAFYILDSDGDRLPFGTSGTLTLPGNLTGSPNNLTLAIDHADLESAGMQPHTSIDSHLGDATKHFTQAEIDHQTILNRGTQTHAAIDSHLGDATRHFTQAEIDHQTILNRGTQTHAAIDSHLGDATKHFTQAEISHSAIIGAAGFQNHSAIDAHISNSSAYFSAIDTHTGDTSIHFPIFDNLSTSSGAVWSSAYTKNYVDVTGGGFVLSVDDETTTASPVNSITFDPAGFTVTDNGSGSATVTNLGGTGGGGLVVDTDTTCYVATTGSDTTGDGSAGNPYATPHTCLDAYAGHVINNDVWLTIELANGTYALTETLQISHRNGDRIWLKGANTYTKSLTSIASGSGSSGAYSVVLNISDTVNVSVNDYVIIRDATGGTNPTYIDGCWKITGVSGPQITVSSSHRTGYPSGAVTGSVTVVKSILSFTGVSNDGVYAVDKQLGKIDGLVIANVETSWKSGLKVDGNSVVTGTSTFGVSNAYVGIYAAGNARFDGNATVSGSFAGITLAYGPFLSNLQKIVLTGNTNGIWATMQAGGSFGLYGASVISGCNTAIFAEHFAYVDMRSTVLTGNTTTSSPALNVLGNTNAYIRN